MDDKRENGKNGLWLQVIDPSGHKRILRLNQLPCVLGTNLQEKNALRDSKIKSDALVIEENFRLNIVQDNLLVQLGDLRLQSLELPLNIPLKIGDTELQFSKEVFKNETLQFPASERPWYTESSEGVSLLHSLRKAANSDLSIYLFGETGTGKEVLAKLTHCWSMRAKGPFVPINCGALPLSLAESELFGHVKGSFTGAIKDRAGAFLQANGGTLFLDEVGDLPHEIQVKLLRFLENGEMRPVGSDRVLHSNVRIICATHKPLAKLVKEGKFRQDLYYRLASIPMQIPSLRSRPEDIKALGQWFALDQDKYLTEKAILKLQSYSWPGNVRELRHAIERASGLVGKVETLIHAKDLDFIGVNEVSDHEEVLEAGQLPGILSIKEMEKVLILRALKIAKGNRTDAAKVLGVARSTLFEMIKRHNIIGPKAIDYWGERFLLSK